MESDTTEIINRPIRPTPRAVFILILDLAVFLRLLGCF